MSGFFLEGGRNCLFGNKVTQVRLAGLVRVLEGELSSADMKICFRTRFMQKISDAFLMLKISKYYEYISKRKYNRLKSGYVRIIQGEILFPRCESSRFVQNRKQNSCVKYVITIKNSFHVSSHLILISI